MVDDPISGRFPNRRHDAVLAEARRVAADIRRRAERDAQTIRRDAAEWAASTRREAEVYRDQLMADAEQRAATLDAEPDPTPAPGPVLRPSSPGPDPNTAPTGTGTAAVPEDAAADLDTRDFVDGVLAEHRRRGRRRMVGLALFGLALAAAGAGFVVLNLPDDETVLPDGASVSEVRPEIPATVPDLVDLPVDVRERPLADVIDELHDAGLDVTFDRVFDDEVPAGHVVSMAGTATVRLPRGTTVPLLVSKGPAPVEVPDVVGKSFDEAVAQLRSAGLTVGHIRGDGTGPIRDQAPDAGTAVPRDTPVNLRPGT